MKLVSALHVPGSLAREHATTGRGSDSLINTSVSVIVGLLMLLGLFVSVPVLP